MKAFFKDKNLIATSVRSLEYIQISKDISTQMEIENHAFPEGIDSGLTKINLEIV